MLSSLHWRILVPPSTQVRSGKRKCRTLARKIERNTKQIIFIALSFFSHEIEIVPRRKIFSVATFSFLPIMSCACVCVCACLSVCVCVCGWVGEYKTINTRSFHGAIYRRRDYKGVEFYPFALFHRNFSKKFFINQNEHMDKEFSHSARRYRWATSIVCKVRPRTIVIVHSQAARVAYVSLNSRTRCYS